MKPQLIVLVCLLCGLSVRLPAQSISDGNAESIEEILLPDDIEDEGAALENIDQILHHRMDLNKVSAEELSMLNVLSVEQVSAIVRHRAEHGRFLSVYELQSIPELDLDVIRKLRGHVKVVDVSEVIDKSLVRRIRSDGESYLAVTSAWTLQKKRGFIPQEGSIPFEGLRPRILLRYRTFRPADFSFGITGENDEGERFRLNSGNAQYGFDHLAWHLQLMNKGRIRNVIIGNYQCQFGQGLIFGGALGFGKSAESITGLRRPNIGLVPYSSAYEGGYFQGAGLTYDLAKSISVTALWSRVNRDASVEENTEDMSVSSTNSTGLHRTPNEQLKRKLLEEQLYGLVVTYKKKAFEAGVAMQRITYPIPIIRKPTLYNQFSFSGTENTNAGLFFNYTLHNIALFGEVANTLSHGHAMNAGMLVSLSKKFDISVSYRKYERNYHPFYASGFSEGSSPQNESGIYWGWKYRFNRRFSYAGYLDWFTFPWLRFRTYAPSQGTEWLMRMTWQLSRHSSIYLQVKQEKKRRNSDESLHQYSVSPITKNSLWLNADYTITNMFKMRTRLNVSQFESDKATTYGTLLFHDISFTWRKLKCTARYAIFETDDFDTRLYAYEHDVWMNFSLPAYHGKGTRTYLLLQYKLNKQVAFWMKYSQTRYLNVDSMGSGMDLINGNQRNDIKFEARLTF